MQMHETKVERPIQTYHELRILNNNLRKQLSFKRNFLMSMLNGVGYAIGATLIAGVVIAILSASIRSIQDVPVLKNLLTQETINLLKHSESK